MDRLKDTLVIIDENLKSFYKNTRFYGLVSLEKKRTETVPVSYKGFGDNEYAMNDDMGIYHRLVDFSLNQDNENGFGRSPLNTETYSMKMVVHGNQRVIDDTNIDINTRVADDLSILLPVRLTKAQATSLEAQSVILIKGAKNFNRDSLWSEELPDTVSKLKPESLYFAIFYQIEMKFI